MLTAHDNALSDLAHGLRQAADHALAEKSAEQFQAVEKLLADLETAVRETQQSLWASEINTAIQRLENGAPLSAQDRDVVRAMLVSDAETYLAHENNYNDWVVELCRLLDDITRRATTITRENVGDLRGVLKDAARLVPSLRNYFEELQRVQRFNVAIENPDKRSRELLAQILTEQLHSPRR